MITRCPTCNTAFRVTEAQLSARGGQVRCGACTHVFDASASLQELTPAPTPADLANPSGVPMILHDTVILPCLCPLRSRSSKRPAPYSDARSSYPIGPT